MAMEGEMENARMNNIDYDSRDAEFKERNDTARSEAATPSQNQKSNGQLQPSFSSRNTFAGGTGSSSQIAESESSSAPRHGSSRITHDDHDEAFHKERRSHEHLKKPNKKKQRVKPSGGFLA